MRLAAVLFCLLALMAAAPARAALSDQANIPGWMVALLYYKLSGGMPDIDAYKLPDEVAGKLPDSAARADALRAMQTHIREKFTEMDPSDSFSVSGISPISAYDIDNESFDLMMLDRQAYLPFSALGEDFAFVLSNPDEFRRIPLSKAEASDFFAANRGKDQAIQVELTLRAERADSSQLYPVDGVNRRMIVARVIEIRLWGGPEGPLLYHRAREGEGSAAELMDIYKRAQATREKLDSNTP